MSGWWRRQPRWTKWAARLAALAVAFILPIHPIARVMAPGSDWRTLLVYPIGVYVLLAVGLNMVVGQAGMLDLGYVAFFAIGAYTMALLGVNEHWNFWLVLPVGIAVAGLAGVVLGAPTLRLRGDYLAIVTLGFGEIVRISANNLGFTGGPRGISGVPHPPSVRGVSQLTYGVLDQRPYYYLLVAAIVVVIGVARRLERSRVGRAWASIREDEDAAELMGVPTLRFKLWAFAIGAMVGGMTGVIFASKVISITPDNFTLLLSFLVLAAVVLGGSGNLPGVILGAFVVAWLPEYFRGAAAGKQLTHVLNRVIGAHAHDFTEYRTMLFGAALVALMIFRPQGLLPSGRRQAELHEGDEP
ncbi:MAG: branched-chain amino acid ABC transporter permease [Acidimicrobiales bacterium]